MSEVAGMYELEDLACYALNDHPDPDEWTENKERIQALLRNRQELIEIIESIEELDAVGLDAPDDLAALFAKAKELDNE